MIFFLQCLSVLIEWCLDFDFRDHYQDVDKYREDFAAFAGSIVCESEKLITIGDEVAEACTEETLKKVLVECYHHIISICVCVQNRRSTETI